MTLCLDTTALMQIHDGDARILPHLYEETTTTDLTLAEFYGVVYRKLGEKTAEHWQKKFITMTRPVGLRTLFAAVKLKEDSKKERLSFFDCVGYVYAQEHGMKFLTSDAAFKGKKGVVFVG